MAFGQNYTVNDEAELCIRINSGTAHADVFLNILMQLVEQIQQKYPPSQDGRKLMAVKLQKTL